jgi:class 3 adenylate cyclase
VSTALVDLAADPRAARRRRLSWLVNVVAPVLGVAAVIGSLAGIAAYSYANNRRDALALTAEALSALGARVEQQVVSFLQPARSATDVMADVLADTPIDDRRAMASRLGLSLMLDTPQLALFSFGQDDGSYLALRRMPDGAIDTKLIDVGPTGRVVQWIRRTPDGAEKAREVDPKDTFDPRARPWYKGAAAAPAEPFWTDVYMFFTARRPGITVSRAVEAPPNGAVVGVVGFDLSLDALSAFLGTIKVGDSGTAMIVDREGRLVAYPDPDAVAREGEGGTLRTARLDELPDTTIARAWDRARILGPGQNVIELDGERIIVLWRSLKAVTGRDWTLLAVVPEDDFVGFVAANNQRVMVMSLGVVALAGLLALALARQGLRAERAGRLARARAETLASQSAAYEAIGAALAEGGSAEPGSVTARIAEVLGARRVSLWSIDRVADAILCVEAYDREGEGHTGGIAIRRPEAPEFFEAALAGETLSANDAASDPRLGAIAEHYLSRLGSRALISAPIRAGGHVGGFLWIEDPAGGVKLDAAGEQFLKAVVAMLGARHGADAETPRAVSQSLASVAVERPAQASPLAMRTSSLAIDRSERFRERLTREGKSPDALAHADTTVLVLRFTDALALAQATGECTAIDDIVRRVQQLADEHNVDYVKIMADQIVMADGFGGEPTRAAATLADVAIEIQDHCQKVFTKIGRRGSFAVGIDTGPVMGGAVGFRAGAYNLWGEAVQTAAAMADGAPLGAVQVTDTTHRLLTGAFLFRPRGTFWIDGQGEVPLYVLRGRA